MSGVWSPLGSRWRGICGDTAAGAAGAPAGVTRAGTLAAAVATCRGGPDAGAAGAEAASTSAVADTSDDHPPASAPTTSAIAIARNPMAGPQRSFLGSWRGGLATGFGTTARQGAAVLDVDTFQPMRSWPYWFQIGLLPPVNDV